MRDHESGGAMERARAGDVSNEPAGWMKLADQARAAIDGDSAERQQFWLAVAPHLELWVRNPRYFGPLSRSEDSRRDILLCMWERLYEGEFRRMRLFFERADAPRSSASPPDRLAMHFRNWLRVVLRRVGIDYQRSIPEYIRNPVAKIAGQETGPASVQHWRKIVCLTTGKNAFREPTTLRIVATQLLDHLDDSIAEPLKRALSLERQGASSHEMSVELGLRGPGDVTKVLERARERAKYRAAVALWSQNRSNEEIAQELELDDAKHADRMVRAAKRLLQRRFRPQGQE